MHPEGRPLSFRPFSPFTFSAMLPTRRNAAETNSRQVPAWPRVAAYTSFLFFVLYIAASIAGKHDQNPAGSPLQQQNRLQQQQGSVTPPHSRANSTAFVKLLNAALVVITSHAETVAGVGPSNWDMMGMVGEVPQEVLDFLSYADDTDIHTLCEVGFNAGHSAAVLLSAHPTSVYHVFDVAAMPYSEAHTKLFKRMYGDRFNFHKGSSFSQLPQFRKEGIICDLFSIDGDHSYEGAVTDFWNALYLMKPGGRLVADDISPDFPGVGKAWDWLQASGFIKQQHCGAYTMARGLRKGWCMAEVQRIPSAQDAPPEGYKQ